MKLKSNLNNFPGNNYMDWQTQLQKDIIEGIHYETIISNGVSFYLLYPDGDNHFLLHYHSYTILLNIEGLILT